MIKKVILRNRGINNEIHESIVTYDDERYRVMIRMWCDKDGNELRPWMPDEYLKQSPEEVKEILYATNDEILNCQEAHCIETRIFTTKDTNGTKASLMMNYNYKEHKYNHPTKNNRHYVFEHEYDGWQFGLE